MCLDTETTVTHDCMIKECWVAEIPWRSDSGISWSSKQSRAVLNKPVKVINWTVTIDASLLRFQVVELAGDQVRHMVRESGGAGVVTRGMWAIGCLTAAVWTFLSLRSFSLARATSKRNPICDDAKEHERELGEEHGKDGYRWEVRKGNIEEALRQAKGGGGAISSPTLASGIFTRVSLVYDSEAVKRPATRVSSLEEQQQWGYCFHSDSNKKSEWCIDAILGNPPHLAANCLTLSHWGHYKSALCPEKYYNQPSPPCKPPNSTLFLYTMLFNKLALTLLSIIAVAAAMPMVNDVALDRRDCQSQGTQGDGIENLNNCSGNFGRP
ncbi:hypothetical protein L210DRAFT_3499136 [Boletus edulis BED1]|uniref:Uncharacterized protein n=1 Tax=Boletus edulis BED1 TaxID=1328754 RepID=A0AAD4C9E1_BOLED|nr:hypothetical protein L210DRAFT_3499136 [Boletus edulis BED1]